MSNEIKCMGYNTTLPSARIQNIDYDEISFFREGLAKVKKDGKYGYIDRAGKEVIPCQYDDADRFNIGLAAVSKDGKYGYIDRMGKEVIPFKYFHACRFSDNGLAVVSEHDDIYTKVITSGHVCFSHRISGLIDRTGKEIVPCKYFDIEDFIEGLAIVGGKGEYGYKYGLIDETGKEIVPCQYDGIYPFKEGLARVYKNGKYGYIDRTGKEIVPCQYDFAFSFSEGLARVKNRNGIYISERGLPIAKYTNYYIDKTGKAVITHQYIEDDFSEGLARVSKNGKYGYIDKTGKEVIPCQYTMAYDFNGDLARVVNKRSIWIDKTGKKVCDYIDDFNDGLAIVARLNNDGRYIYGYIDKTGKEVIPCQYANADNFSEGLAKVARLSNDGRYIYGYIDKTGKEIVPCKFYNAEKFSNGFALLANMHYLINKMGKEVIPMQNDIIFVPDENLIEVIKKGDGTARFFDKEGKELVSSKHGHCSYIDENMYVLYLFNQNQGYRQLLIDNQPDYQYYNNENNKIVEPSATEEAKPENKIENNEPSIDNAQSDCQKQDNENNKIVEPSATEESKPENKIENNEPSIDNAQSDCQDQNNENNKIVELSPTEEEKIGDKREKNELAIIDVKIKKYNQELINKKRRLEEELRMVNNELRNIALNIIIENPTMTNQELVRSLNGINAADISEETGITKQLKYKKN